MNPPKQALPKKNLRKPYSSRRFIGRRNEHPAIPEACPVPSNFCHGQVPVARSSSQRICSDSESASDKELADFICAEQQQGKGDQPLQES